MLSQPPLDDPKERKFLEPGAYLRYGPALRTDTGFLFGSFQPLFLDEALINGTPAFCSLFPKREELLSLL